MGINHDEVSGHEEHADANRCLYIPFTEGYFRSAVTVLATKPDPPDLQTLAALLRRHYGLTGTLTLLSSEVECTTGITLPTGEQLILKTSSQPEARDSFRFQANALASLSNPSGFAVSRILRTANGDLMFQDGSIYCYLQTRLSGVPLHKASASHDLLFQMGKALGQLGQALDQQKLPGIWRPVLWHIGCWARLVELEAHLPQGPVADCVRRAMISYVEFVEPNLHALPWQITHNDPSPFNTLLTDDGIGFIDFGDGCWGPRIQDLAIAASHLVADAALPLGGAESLIAGYASVAPLSALEAKLLPGLMKARQSALILINYWRAGLFPNEAEYIKKNVARAERGLSILSSSSADETEAAVMRAIS